MGRKILKKVKIKSAVTLNGFSVKSVKPSEICRDIFCAIPGIHLWSYESLKNFYTGVLETVSDFCTEQRLIETDKGRKTQLSRFKGRVTTYLKNIPAEQDQLVRRIYEMILSADGMGVLANYGHANKQGNPIRGNAGYESLLKPYL